MLRECEQRALAYLRTYGLSRADSDSPNYFGLKLRSGVCEGAFLLPSFNDFFSFKYIKFYFNLPMYLLCPCFNLYLMRASLLHRKGAIFPIEIVRRGMLAGELVGRVLFHVRVHTRLFGMLAYTAILGSWWYIPPRMSLFDH